MVITKPLNVLVCLTLLLTLIWTTPGRTYSGSDLSTGPGLQGDTLSADPRTRPPQQYRAPAKRAIRSPAPQFEATRTHRVTRAAEPVREKPPTFCPSPLSSRPLFQPPQLGAPPGQACSPVQPCLPRFGQTTCTAYLPRIGPKQFQAAARLWWGKLNSTTILWGGNLLGNVGSEIDLNRDLALGKYAYIPEFEGRCQIRPNWGLRFNFMPLDFRANTTPQVSFFFGNGFYPVGLPILTTWNRNIYRWDIVYDWYQAPHAVASIFSGYSLYDDKLVITNVATRRSRSRTFGLAYAGGSLERVVRNVGGGVFSTNCKFSVQFLEGYFGWDGYAAGRMSIPMGCGRFGYLEGGWRWIVLDRDDPAYRDKTSLDGAIGAVGLVF
jgi:hypothetical protein